MFWRYAYFMPYVNQKLKQKTRLTRYIPSLFVLSIILPILFGVKYRKLNYITLISLISYYITAFMVVLGKTNINYKFKLLLLIAFSVSHIAYGSGFLVGYISFVFLDLKPKEIVLDVNR